MVRQGVTGQNKGKNMKTINKITIGLLTLSIAASVNAATTLKMGMQASVGSVEYYSAKMLADTLEEMS